MKIFCFFKASLLFLLVAIATRYSSVDASPPAATPISHVQVTLKGKKYDINDVTTVSELQDRLEEASGVSPSQQGRILFQGKRITSSSSLSDAGVTDGDQLNCVPSTSTKKKTSSTTASTTTTTKTKAATTTTPSSSSASSSMKDILQNAGMDTSGMEDMVKQMMGGGAGDGSMKPPSLEESMDMMTSMMKSPIFTEYMNDPDKLEQSRQMILNNPMLKSMMGSMPGMEELLNDPEAWKQAMQAAAQMYSQMDPEDLKQAMMQGADASMAGMPGVPGGLFDGTVPTTPTALDELSEGEE
jgi:hypothetical protein